MTNTNPRRVNERTLSVELRTDEGVNMNELFLSQDIRNLKPRLPNDGESHLVRLTNVSLEGVLSLQIDGPGLTSLGEVLFVFLSLERYFVLGKRNRMLLCCSDSKEF